MGGCATKPKVSKGGDAGEPPAPAPEPAKEEAVAAAASETKAVEAAVTVPDTVEKKDEAAKIVEVVREGGEEYSEGVKEIVVEDDKVDEQVNKRRSLGLLFNTEKEEKSTPEIKNPSSEPAKPKETSAAEPSTKKPDTDSKPVEAEKPLPATEPKQEPALGPVVEAAETTEPKQEPALATAVEVAEKAEQERVIKVAEAFAAESTRTVEEKAEEEKVAAESTETVEKKVVEEKGATDEQQIKT